jgi:hypothetical protein
MHHPDALPQRDPRPWPARDCCPVGRFGYLEVIHASDVLDDVIRQICDGHHRQRLNKLLWMQADVEA